MHMEGLTVGADCNKQQTDFNASCVSVLAEDFLDPMDGALGNGLHDSQVSDLDLDSSVFGSDVSGSESGSDSESESESEDEEDENDEPQPEARAAPPKRGLMARMASSDSLFGGGRGMPPRRPPKAESKAPRRGFLARMAYNDSLFGGPRGAPPRRPTNESSSKPNRRGLLSRMNSSDSLFAGIMPSFGKSHKPHGTKTRRGGRRNRGGTKQQEEEDDAPKRGVTRMNTDDSLTPAPARSVQRTSTSDTLEAAKSHNDSDKVTPPSARTRRGGRRNKANVTEQKDTAPPQRGVVRNNTSDSLVQSSRPLRRAGRRPPKPSSKCPDSPNGGLTEGESCSESSTMLENSANLITI